jgi:hypothetical protein
MNGDHTPYINENEYQSINRTLGVASSSSVSQVHPCRTAQVTAFVAENQIPPFFPETYTAPPFRLQQGSGGLVVFL